MKDTNQHGLRRYIPAAIRRTVRQECGFGCIFCGGALVQYHHFDPPFVNAYEHRAAGIALLCPTCHSRFEDVPIEEMRQCRDAPYSKQVGLAHDSFLFGLTQIPSVKLGRVEATSGQIIRHEDRLLLGLLPPEAAKGPLRLTCELRDKRGVLLLRIKDNILTVGADHFDVQLHKKSLVIRRKMADIVLQMTTNRVNQIEISHLEAYIAGGTISCNPTLGLSVQAPSGGKTTVSQSIIGPIGIWITNDSVCLLGGGLSTAAGAAQVWR